MSYKQLILNRKVTDVTIGVSKTFENNSNSNDYLLEVPTIIEFDKINLSIYNRFEYTFGVPDIYKIVGSSLTNIEETNDYFKMTFSNGFIITVDLTDSAFIGPEAMHLFGEGYSITWDGT